MFTYRSLTGKINKPSIVNRSKTQWELGLIIFGSLLSTTIVGKGYLKPFLSAGYSFNLLISDLINWQQGQWVNGIYGDTYGVPYGLGSRNGC